MSGWTMIGYHCLMDTLWIWAISILINLIALFWGSGLAFMIGIGMQMVFTAALFVGNYAEKGKWIQWLLKINPAAHLVMGWHKNFVPDNGDDIGIYFPALDLNYSLLIFLLFLLIIIGIGAFVIKRFDIMASEMETGVY